MDDGTVYGRINNLVAICADGEIGIVDEPKLIKIQAALLASIRTISLARKL